MLTDGATHNVWFAAAAVIGNGLLVRDQEVAGSNAAASCSIYAQRYRLAPAKERANRT